MLSMIAAFIFTACLNNNKEKSPAISEEPVINSPAAEVQAETRRQGRVAILIRGNEWINGIPGIDDNGFPALTGEYRIQAAGTGESREFSVYLSQESIHFNDDWQQRKGTGSTQVYQTSTDEGFMAAASLDDGKGVLWTALFLFPNGIEGSGLSDDAFNQMLRVWLSRLLYFLSLAKTTGEISIPAVVEF